jgi:hypothetical protein
MLGTFYFQLHAVDLGEAPFPDKIVQFADGDTLAADQIDRADLVRAAHRR